MTYNKTVWKDDTRTQRLKLGLTDNLGYQAVQGVTYQSDGQEGVPINAAHLNNLENEVSLLDTLVQMLYDALYYDITGNPFSVTFENLTGIELTSGIWNDVAQRLEC